VGGKDGKDKLGSTFSNFIEYPTGNHMSDEKILFIPKRVIRQFSKFIAVGLTALAVDVTIMNLVSHFVTEPAFGEKWGVLTAQGISWFFAVTIVYILNKRWTFRDGTTGKRDVGVQLSKHYTVYVIGLLIRSAIIWTIYELDDWLTVRNWVVISTFVDLLEFRNCAFLTAVVIVTIYDFLAARRFVFNRKGKVETCQNYL